MIIVRFIIFLLLLILSFESFAERIELVKNGQDLKINFYGDKNLLFNTKFEGRKLFIYFNHAVKFSLKDILEKSSVEIEQADLDPGGKILEITLKDKDYRIISSPDSEVKNIALVREASSSNSNIFIPIARPNFEKDLEKDSTEQKSNIIQKGGRKEEDKNDQSEANQLADIGNEGFSFKAKPNGQTWFVNFSNLVSAAVFKKDKFLWLVFDDKIDLDLEAVKEASNGNIESYMLLPNSKYTILRVTYSKLPLVKVSREYFTWIIDIEAVAEEGALVPENQIVEENVQGKRDKFFPLERPRSSLTVLDPEKGTLLEIVPSFYNSLGILKSQIAPEYVVLNSAQGLAIEIISDAAKVKVEERGASIIVSQEQNPLIVQEANYDNDNEEIEEEIREYKLQPSIIKFEHENGNFMEEWHRLLVRSMNYTKENRFNKLFPIVKFYTIHGLDREGASLCNFIARRDTPFNKTNIFLAYYAFLSLKLGDYNQALKSIGEMDFKILDSDRREEVNFFKNIAQYKLDLLKEEIDYSFIYRKFLQYYPPKIRYYFAEFITQYALGKKDIVLANSIISKVLEGQPDHYTKNSFLFYKASLAELENDTTQAKEIYKVLSQDIEDNFNRARAIFNKVKIQVNEKSIDYNDAIKELELAQVIWRGDDLELEISSYLATLDYNNQNYANAMRQWKAIIEDAPNSREYLSVMSKISDLFMKLFVDKSIDSNLNPIQYLALYYEFKEYTPRGSRGDLAAANLAKEAIDLDLLEEAIKVLDYQVKYRLALDNKDETINQVAILYVKMEKLDEAMQYLIEAEKRDIARLNYKTLVERSRLKALILKKKREYQLSLKLIEDDVSVAADALRAEIYWELEDWPNVEKYILYKLANPTGKETNAQMSKDILKLAISYNRQGKNAQILNIVNRYPNIIAYNVWLGDVLSLLLERSEDISYADIKKGLNLDTISDIIKAARK